MPISNMSTTSSHGSCKAVTSVANQFPAGLRVLVVDDDMTCLKILERMLRECLYHVTTCCGGSIALSLLRERKGDFDVVISDVHMPDMDGYALLEHVGLEMDLPVIMMSGDGSTSTVMRGIKHGACDYLIKPVRIEELKNIWQHVVRKKRNENKELEHSVSFDDSDHRRRLSDDVDYGSSFNEGTDGNWKVHKKRNAKEDEDDCDLESDDPSTTKKPRVVWSVELHQQFVSAVNQLGIDKAVPKRILELMNVPGLTRENVASHLQKFRLYLKRLSGVTQHQSGIPSSFCGPAEPNGKLNALGRLDIQALAASGQIHPQTLAALHADLLGRPTSGLVLPTMDQPVFLQASIQGGKCIPIERGVAFGQPLIKCQSNASKQFPQPTVSVGDIQSSLATWPPNHLSAVGPAGATGVLDAQNNSMLVRALKQQHQQQQQQQQAPALPESSQTINVQPSCVVLPSQSSKNFQSGANPRPINFTPNSGFVNSSSTLNFSALPQSNTIILGGRQLSNGDIKNLTLLNGYSIQDGSICPPLSSPMCTESSSDWSVQSSVVNGIPSSKMSGPIPNACDIPSSYVTNTGTLTDQGPGHNLGFVGKGMSIPSRFAVDDIELPTDEFCPNKFGAEIDVGRVKQEVINHEYVEGARVGVPMHQYSQSDLMSVLSK